MLSAAGRWKVKVEEQWKERVQGSRWLFSKCKGKRRCRLEEAVIVCCLSHPLCSPPSILLSTSISATQLKRPWTACYASAILFSQYDSPQPRCHAVASVTLLLTLREGFPSHHQHSQYAQDLDEFWHHFQTLSGAPFSKAFSWMPYMWLSLSVYSMSSLWIGT